MEAAQAEPQTISRGTPMSSTITQESAMAIGSNWYDLFSRGARDWLRHNEKVRRAVRDHLPELIAHADILTSDGQKRVRIPVRFLEHYRFRLLPEESPEGVGQGDAKPGDLLRPAKPESGDEGGEGAGSEGGGYEFLLEFKVDEIVDWLWEELQLPDLKPKENAASCEETLVREGIDRRGVRARLDRRRTVKEAIKRRRIQRDPPPFTNDDLRFRQLKLRPRPSTQAAVLFGLDASSSMGDYERKLAKTFFFWALQGIRRQYPKVEVAFIAHTVEAWEFEEEQFFQVHAHGGTMASSCFRKALELVESRFDPSRYNVYLFYASDGDNFPEDRQRSLEALEKLSEQLTLLGYVEISQAIETEMGFLFRTLKRQGAPVESFSLFLEEEVWEAIRHFFKKQAEAA